MNSDTLDYVISKLERRVIAYKYAVNFNSNSDYQAIVNELEIQIADLVDLQNRIELKI